MRLFVALPLPAAIAEAASRLLPELRVLRPVRPELMHITLAFLGPTLPERLTDAAAAIDTVRDTPAFDVSLEHAGRFPERGRPHIVWIGAAQGADEIHAVGARVRAELEARGLAFDPKPLQAHVTIARVREGADAIDARAIAAAVRAIRVPPLRFHAAEIVLFESVLSPTGPRYTSRATAPLRVGGRP